MASMAPLAMAAGEIFEGLAAGVGRKGGHGRGSLQTDVPDVEASSWPSSQPPNQAVEPVRPSEENPLLGILSFNEAGLIPAVAQDWLDGAVLMVAWMNRDALLQTLASGEVHYWSRSRQQLWHKGASSGHYQKLKGLRYDCDADVLLLSIEQVGEGACHTGARSCFYDDGLRPEGPIASAGGPGAPPPPADVCSELARLIAGRRDNPEANSYTNSLLAGGDNRILKKIGEESAEFVMACKDDDPGAIAGEAADLIFHLQVALAHHHVEWRQVLAVLAQRRGAPRR